MKGYRREEFELLRRAIFFNWASLSPPPRSAIERLKRTLMFDERDTIPLEKQSEQMRNEAATLLNARQSEIACPGSSTTQGIQLAIDSINPSAGENMVTASIEFPTAGFEAIRLRRKGVEVRVADCGDGRVDADRIEKLADDRTRVILVSGVNWITGYRTDIRRIAEIAENRGAYLVVDAVQQMGASAIDVRRTEPDFIAAGGQKWLFSPFGAALLFVNRKRSDELEEPYPSLNNTVEPEEGWPSYFANEENDPFDVRQPLRTARRFEHGGWLNHFGMIGLAESLKIINSIGIERVERRIGELYDYAAEQIQNAGGRIISSLEPDERSSILTFRLRDSWKSHLDIVNALAARGCILSCRGAAGVGGIRMAIHCFNDEEDVDRMMEEIRRF
ncbi:MAG: aminotransferase class V-fold PLP-dependent enzyme [Candidatus Thermoplasmatota archaeon]|nr:aminotransferase class V-fold PLP-dependent enzyme [Candidatus Thermoplasmatota archaeon]